MNLEKLVKTLRGEVVRSPKKAALLAAISLLAAYFWAPLIYKWTSGGSSRSDSGGPAGSPSADIASVASAAEPVAAASTKPKATPHHRWQDVIRWIEADPRMKPAEPVADRRNPFGPDQHEVLAAQRQLAQAAAEKPEPPDVTPEQLGLVLSGTAVGSQVRAATINGRTYREGARLVVGLGAASAGGRGKPATGAAPTVEFTLVAIRPNEAVLQRNGRQFTLKMRQPGMAGADEIIWSLSGSP